MNNEWSWTIKKKFVPTPLLYNHQFIGIVSFIFICDFISLCYRFLCLCGQHGEFILSQQDTDLCFLTMKQENKPLQVMHRQMKNDQSDLLIFWYSATAHSTLLLAFLPVVGEPKDSACLWHNVCILFCATDGWICEAKSFRTEFIGNQIEKKAKVRLIT